MSDINKKSGKRIVLKDIRELGDIVSRRRSELRLRLEDVAKLSDVSRHLVSSVEKGDPGNQVEKLLRILDSLQISVELKKEKPKHVDIPPDDPKPARTRKTPIVPIDKMFTQDGRIICLECGSKVKNIHMHARQSHGLNIAGYRQRWNIPESQSFSTKKKDAS
jgi:transcriptional regulator with XRE-family HTH domain